MKQFFSLAVTFLVLGILFPGRVVRGDDSVPGSDSVPGATVPIARETDRFRNQAERVKQGSIQFLMIGDSFVHRWEPFPIYPDLCGVEVWNEYYSNRKSLNMGNAGDRTNHILWRLKTSPLEKISPEICVLEVGSANLAAGNTPEETLEGITAIVDLLLQRFPKTVILLMELFPQTESQNDPFRQAIDHTNALLRQRYGARKKDQVILVLVENNFLNRMGVPRKDYMPDGRHLSPEGYRAWAKLIESEVLKRIGTNESFIGRTIPTPPRSGMAMPGTRSLGTSRKAPTSSPSRLPLSTTETQ